MSVPRVGLWTASKEPGPPPCDFGAGRCQSAYIIRILGYGPRWDFTGLQVGSDRGGSHWCPTSEEQGSLARLSSVPVRTRYGCRPAQALPIMNSLSSNIFTSTTTSFSNPVGCGPSCSLICYFNTSIAPALTTGWELPSPRDVAQRWTISL